MTGATPVDAKGYVTTFAKISSPDEFEAYPAMVGPTLTKYGEKMLEKGMLKDAAYVEKDKG
jgi:uncharacterized protein (DUF1330 family)